jgi:hypothetical protein
MLPVPQQSGMAVMHKSWRSSHVSNLWRSCLQDEYHVLNEYGSTPCMLLWLWLWLQQVSVLAQHKPHTQLLLAGWYYRRLVMAARPGWP